MFAVKAKATYCYGYIRVSTVQQGEDGTSIENQKDIIAKWVQARGHKLAMIEADIGLSGTLKAEKRPGLAKILRNIQRDEVFLTISTSRLGRNYTEAINIIDWVTTKQAFYVSIEENYDTSTPTGTLTMQIMSAIALLQATQISNYSKESAESFKRLGRHTGGIPYGYRKKSPEPGSGLEEDPEEQQIITLIRSKKQEGLSFTAIAKYLTNAGVPSPGKGKKWYVDVLIKIHNRTDVHVKGRDDVADQLTQKAITKIDNK